MRLVIKRSQQDVKSVLGLQKAVAFTLHYRLELTLDESAAVSRYGLGSYPVTWATVQGNQVPDDTIANMVAGRTQTIQDVTTLLRNERVIKDAGDELPVLFDI